MGTDATTHSQTVGSFLSLLFLHLDKQVDHMHARDINQNKAQRDTIRPGPQTSYKGLAKELKRKKRVQKTGKRVRDAQTPTIRSPTKTLS